jgi:hypothetical protein
MVVVVSLMHMLEPQLLVRSVKVGERIVLMECW